MGRQPVQPAPSAPAPPRNFSSPGVAAAVAPDPQAVQMLEDMGFAPAAVRDALLRTGNDLNEALGVLTA
jgi:hypothetical protein